MYPNMALSFSTSSFVTITIIANILFTNLLTSPALASANVSQTDVETVCLQTTDAEFCRKVINSDPRTPKADYRGLTQITIDLTRAFVKETSAFLESLMANATGSGSAVAKQRYSACLGEYGRALNDVAYADECLKGGNLRGVFMGVLGCQVAAMGCDREFEAPPADKSGIMDRNRKLRLYREIVSFASFLVNDRQTT